MNQEAHNEAIGWLKWVGIAIIIGVAAFFALMYLGDLIGIKI